MEQDIDRWKPFKNGIYYGSKGCCNARSCTLVEFDNAGIKARQLADRIGGDTKVRVWENLGWHYAVIVNGKYRITESRHTGLFSCYAVSESMYVGHGETPQEAIADFQRQVTDAITNLQRLTD